MGFLINVLWCCAILLRLVAAHRVLEGDKALPCGTLSTKEPFFDDEPAPRLSSMRFRPISLGSDSATKKVGSVSGDSTNVCTGCITLDVYFHVIEDENRTSDASTLATDETLTGVLAKLNSDFSLTPFQFNLVEIKRFTDDDWAFGRVMGRTLAEEISAGVRMGGADVLNVIISDGSCIGDVGEGQRQGGFASLPWLSLEMFPPNQYDEIDHVYICPQALQGETVTHEVGHFLGLLHVFQGETCTAGAAGDYVDDTPQQDRPSHAKTCDEAINFCPDLNQGPITPSNFMEYSDCRDRFTPGQSARMLTLVNEYRRVIGPCSSGLVEAKISVELASVTSGASGTFTSWDRGLGIPLYSPDSHPHIDYANQRLARRYCVSSDRLYEVSFENTDTVIDASITVNGYSVPFSPSDGGVLFFADAQECQFNAVLDIGFAEAPFDIDWSFLGDQGAILAEARETYIQSYDFYSPNFIKKTLHVSLCLPTTTISFRFRNSAAANSNPTSYELSIYEGTSASSEITFSRTVSGSNSAENTFIVSPSGTVIFPQFPENPYSCFSSSNTVEIRGKGTVPIRQIQIGDWVTVSDHVPNAQQFSRVYSLAHWDHETRIEYLQIFTEGNLDPIEISRQHMLIVKGRLSLAGDVKVGDKLALGAYDREVTKITVVTNSGLYAPITEAGEIMVSGVRASSYASFLDVNPTIQAFLYHCLLSPLRLTCRFNIDICQQETYTEGISDRIYWLAPVARAASTLQPLLQLCLLLLFVAIVASPLLLPAIVFLFFRSKFFLREKHRRPKQI